jgi:hypothetical protein
VSCSSIKLEQVLAMPLAADLHQLHGSRTGGGFNEPARSPYTQIFSLRRREKEGGKIECQSISAGY